MGRKSRKRNGWVKTLRTDSRTGKKRPMWIRYQNGKEIEHHWADLGKDPSVQNESETDKDDVDEILKKQFFVKDHYGTFSKDLRKNPRMAAANMTEDELINKINELDEYKISLSERFEIARSNQEKRRINAELSTLKTSLRDIRRYHEEYGKFNQKPKKYPRSKAKQIDEDVKESLYELQEDEREWGGGLNFELRNDKNPAKIVARQGAKGHCKSDPNADISVHTHPTRSHKDKRDWGGFSEYKFNLEDAEENLDNLKKKKKSKQSKDKIEQLKESLTEPWDTLPSSTDIENTRDDNNERTHLIVSDKGAFAVSRQKNSSIKTDLKEEIDGYHPKVMDNALLKSELPGKKLQTIKDAEEKVQKYHEEVIEGTKSMLTSEGFDAEFTPKEEPLEVIVEPAKKRAARRKREKYWYTDETND